LCGGRRAEEARAERERAVALQQAQARRAAEEAAQSEAAQAAAREARARLAALVRSRGEEPTTEVFGEGCVFAVTESDALFADAEGLQFAPVRDITSVRSDNDGRLIVVVRDAKAGPGSSPEAGRRGITVPAAALSMGELEAVFGAMQALQSRFARAERDAALEIEEARLAKCRPAPARPPAPAPVPPRASVGERTRRSAGAAGRLKVSGAQGAGEAAAPPPLSY